MSAKSGEPQHDRVDARARTVERIECIGVTGSLSVLELLEIVERYYQLIGRRSVLWDFSQSGSFKDFGRALHRHRCGGEDEARTKRWTKKTAYVAGDALKYTRLCKYMNVAFSSGVPTEYGVFLTRDASVEWLHRG